MAESGWQPIETAPKNDTEVLVWDPEWGEYPVVAVYSTGCGCWLCDGEFEPNRNPAWRLIPTHWMPLPAPPASTEEDE